MATPSLQFRRQQIWQHRRYSLSDNKFGNTVIRVYETTSLATPPLEFIRQQIGQHRH